MTSSSEPDPGSERRYSAWPHHRVIKPTATEWSARTRRIALILVWWRGFVVNERLKPEAALDGPT